MSELVLSCAGLRKRFPGGVEAVRGVDLELRAGEILALLGPNGAGKTTTVRMLTTLLRPDAGRATIAGHDLQREPARVRRAIGLALQEAGLADYSTGREQLLLMARLYGLTRSAARTRCEELLGLFELKDAAGRLVRTYSGGMKRRLDLACALVHRPQLLFLDEPTAGIDPASRAALWRELRALQQAGVAILLTTHYLEEADRLSDRVAIIDCGLLVAEGTAETLKAEVAADLVIVAVDDGQSEAARSRLADLGAVRPGDDGAVTIETPNGSEAAVVVLDRLQAAGIRPHSVTVARPTLDDVFFRRTGTSIESTQDAA